MMTPRRARDSITNKPILTMKSIKKCVFYRETNVVTFPGSITERTGQITNKKGKKDFFKRRSPIY